LTVFEAIDAVGRPPPPLTIVMRGNSFMASWFPPELDLDVLVIVFKKEIAAEFLKHCIKYSGASQNGSFYL
jgi:hypothetical protein